MADWRTKQKTEHNKIFISRNGMLFGKMKLNQNLKKLHRMAQLMDEEGLLKLLKELVREGNGGEKFFKDF